jgi:hypothetical protein
VRHHFQPELTRQQTHALVRTEPAEEVQNSCRSERIPDDPGSFRSVLVRCWKNSTAWKSRSIQSIISTGFVRFSASQQASRHAHFVGKRLCFTPPAKQKWISPPLPKLAKRPP